VGSKTSEVGEWFPLYIREDVDGHWWKTSWFYRHVVAKAGDTFDKDFKVVTAIWPRKVAEIRESVSVREHRFHTVLEVIVRLATGQML
jgi:hypothetical protein